MLSGEQLSRLTELTVTELFSRHDSPSVRRRNPVRLVGGAAYAEKCLDHPRPRERPSRWRRRSGLDLLIAALVEGPRRRGPGRVRRIQESDPHPDQGHHRPRMGEVGAVAVRT